MSEYVIQYEYWSWSLGCDCCHDYSSEVHIYETSREDGAYMSSFSIGLMENEEELREYINEYHPEYNDFVVHKDTKWF